MAAPTGRIAKVNVTATVTVVMDAPNSLATSLNTKTIRKKSNASSAQPRKLAITTFRARSLSLIALPRLTGTTNSMAHMPGMNIATPRLRSVPSESQM